MSAQFARQKTLLDFYRGHGHYMVAGGSYASLCLELYSDHADCVIAGEAEYLWPAFCRDFENGTARALYHETGVVALADSPTPRFDLLKLERYSTVTLQFSRGCPFLCEFCDIIVMFGRRPRHKNLDQVGRELDALRRHGVRNASFRRRQSDRQPRRRKGAAALPARLPGRPPLPLQLRHRSVAQPGAGRGAARPVPGGEFHLSLRRYRISGCGNAEGKPQDSEHP